MIETTISLQETLIHTNMKVKVPSWIDQVQTEGERLLIAFLWRVAKTEGFDSWYYMIRHDANIIMGVNGCEDFDLGYLYPKVQMTQSIWDQWRFSFLKEYTETEYELTGEREKLVWSYLTGFEQGGNETYICDKYPAGGERHPKHKLKGEQLKHFRGK